MITTQIAKSQIPKAEADELNQESARVYNNVLVNHWRTYRKQGHWLSVNDACRWGDHTDEDTILHAHSRDTAQQAFYKACKTARTNRKNGNSDTRYPHKRKRYRTTVWKNTGIRLRDGKLLLAKARGLDPIEIKVPESLQHLSEESYREARLVWDLSARHYEFHFVIEDGEVPPEPPGDEIVALDLGEIHPVAATDGKVGMIFSCRELRATLQYRNKRLASLAQEQSRYEKYSRRWWRIQKRKNKFSAKMERKTRDIQHKISRAVVDWAVEREVGMLVIGDVRNIGDGKRLHRKSQQKISGWPHGQQRRYIEYKAEREGMETDLENEAYTTQECPGCGKRQKPRGRMYTCSGCGFEGPRDIVGSSGIRSRYVYGELGHDYPKTIKYRRPFVVNGLRSPVGTRQVAQLSQ